VCIFVYLGTFVDIVIFNNRGILYCIVYGFSIFRIFSVLHNHHASLLYLQCKWPVGPCALTNVCMYVCMYELYT